MKFFVYGTLKRGRGNDHRLGNAKFLGEFVTPNKYTMHSLGAFPAVSCKGKSSIQGEVYETDDPRIIQSLYRLEGYSGIPTKDGGHNMYDLETIDTPYGEANMFVMRGNVQYPT